MMKTIDEYFAPFEDQLDKVFHTDSGFDIKGDDILVDVYFEYRDLPVDIIFTFNDEECRTINIEVYAKFFRETCATKIYEQTIKTEDINEDFVYVVLNNCNKHVRAQTTPQELLRHLELPRYLEDAIIGLIRQYSGPVVLK